MIRNASLTDNLLLLFFLTLPFLSFGQNDLIVSGKLTSAEDHQPVPYASIYLVNKNLGTTSNTEGYFEFRIPNKHKNDTIAISCMGFVPLYYPAREIVSRHQFEMKENVILLGMVMVSDKQLTAKEIVKKVVEAIPFNYADTLWLEGYFRKYQTVDKTYISYLDAAVELYDDSFTKSTKPRKLPEMIKIKAVRKSFNASEKGFANWVDQISDQSNWLTRLLLENDIRYRNGLLDSKNVLQLKDMTYYDNKLCYQIDVLTKPWHYIRPDGSNYQSAISMIIDAESFKVYKIMDEEKARETGKKKNFIWIKKVNDKIGARIIGGNKVYEFREYKSKLYLNFAYEVVTVEDFDLKTKETVHTNEYIWELFINKVMDANDVKLEPFIAGKRDDLKMSLTDYDKNFWVNYNLIPFTAENRKAFSDLSKKIPIEKQFERSNVEMKEKGKQSNNRD